jgi:predicted DNA-binding transcriptional regulator AlpA
MAVRPPTPSRSTRTVPNNVSILPSPTRRGLSRIEAADYVGIGETKFDEMVRDGRMPKPKRIDGRKVWDVRALDTSFEDLPFDGNASNNPWDS